VLVWGGSEEGSDKGCVGKDFKFVVDIEVFCFVTTEDDI